MQQLTKEELLLIMTELVSCPLAFTATDGKFLWVNQAFAKMLDYSVPELIGDDGPTWMDLTPDKEDLSNDVDALESLKRNETNSYVLVRKYRAKTGKTIPVRIVVEKYPRNGDRSFFTVTVTELNNGYKDAFDYANGVISNIVRGIAEQQRQILSETRNIQLEQTVLKQNVNDSLWVGNLVTDMWELVKGRPKIALTVMLVVSLLVFGDRTLVVLDKVRAAISIIFLQVEHAQAPVLPPVKDL